MLVVRCITQVRGTDVALMRTPTPMCSVTIVHVGTALFDHVQYRYKEIGVNNTALLY